MSLWAKASFGTKLKKTPRQDIFLENVVPKESFIVASDVASILYNKPCICTGD